jgi:DNA polymerase III epsilon subunit-like protein
VALDCEMAGVQGGSSELILVCMVDFLSGEPLVNKLVEPTERVIDWRTRYSGVTPKAMATATAHGDTLQGWRAARAALWQYIDADTILVGQSLQHDLDVLRMIHIRIVDAGIAAQNAVNSSLHRQWGLKTLCRELLDIEIQGGKKGHDCMEDTLAAREVVSRYIQRPQELASWGLVKKEEEEQKQREQLEKARKLREAQEEAQKASLATTTPKGREAYTDYSSDLGEDDMQAAMLY